MSLDRTITAPVAETAATLIAHLIERGYTVTQDLGMLHVRAPGEKSDLDGGKVVRMEVRESSRRRFGEPTESTIEVWVHPHGYRFRGTHYRTDRAGWSSRVAGRVAEILG